LARGLVHRRFIHNPATVNSILNSEKINQKVNALAFSRRDYV